MAHESTSWRRNKSAEKHCYGSGMHILLREGKHRNRNLETLASLVGLRKTGQTVLLALTTNFREDLVAEGHIDHVEEDQTNGRLAIRRR